MGRIWTPDQLVPEGWNASNWCLANSDVSPPDKKARVKVRIVAATYHKDQEKISLLARFPDGSSRVLPIPKAAFSFRGLSYRDVPREESDREMGKLAVLLERKKGSTITIEAFASQM